jgi:protein pelota
LIIAGFSPKHGRCSLIVESADDLWVLRRLIGRGDIVTSRSSRILKKEDEFSRPDKGERVKVTIALEVQEINLDSTVGRLRIRGTIRESSDETIKKSGSHSLSITPGHAITLSKGKWMSADTKLVNSTREFGRRFLLVTIDRTEAGFGVLSGSHLSTVLTMASGISGKQSEEQNPQIFLGKVSDLIGDAHRDGDVIVVAGPGHTKLALANVLKSRVDLSADVKVIEGFDLTGSDGVRSLLKFDGFQSIARESRLVEMQRLVGEAIRRISALDQRIAYSLPRVKEAALRGAVEACVVSDNVFGLNVSEQEVVDTLKQIEQTGGSVYLVDSSLEAGKQVSAFGGMIATLRYAVSPC